MSKSHDEAPIYIILHIHKCAGMTIARHIAEYLKPNEYLALYKIQHPLLESRRFIQMYISSLSAKKINALRVIAGHGAYYGIHTLIARPCRYVVFLRNPYNRTVSNYAYFRYGISKPPYPSSRKSILDKKGNILSFHDWLSTRTDTHDYMTRFLYQKLCNKTIVGEVTSSQLNSVIKTLETFYQVGLVERMTDYSFLYQSVGIPVYAKAENKTQHIFYPTGCKQSDVTTYLSRDFELYNYFKRNTHYTIPLPDAIGLYYHIIKEYLLGRSA